MIVANLGRGTKTSDHPDVINVDWSFYLVLGRKPVLRRMAPLLLDAERRRRLAALGENIVVHDLSKGIPFESSSVDVVYHSHLLEHLDREVAPSFLAETLRVLKPGGIHRIVVPDLEHIARSYLSHLELCASDPAERRRHDNYVHALIEQSVRREAFSARSKRPARRRIESVLLGDARRRGETHQWMYDWANLGAMLAEAGFESIRRHAFDASDVPGWEAYGLDTDATGGQYKPHSLYLEARKPNAPAP